MPRKIKLPPAGKRDIRTQFGALCYRVHNGKVQVLLITSRSGKRWIIPKGWPAHKSTPARAAAREARQEAGVEGTTDENCLGIFSHVKKIDGVKRPCVVAVFALKVTRIHSEYPEKELRKRQWLSRKKAAVLIENQDLRHLIKEFDPKFSLPRPAGAV